MGAFDEYKFEKMMEWSSLFDIWTQKNAPIHKYLLHVAIEIWSVLVTSSSSERLFSISTHSFGERRLKMTKGNVEDTNFILGNKKISEFITLELLFFLKNFYLWFKLSNTLNDTS